jgi:hypothetical protein
MAKKIGAVKPGPSAEQLERLIGLEGKLLEVALEECDPDNWIDQDKAEAKAKELEEKALQALAGGDELEAKNLYADAKALRKGWKGERYWEKKNATATVSLLTKLELYRQRMEEGRQAGKGGNGDDDSKAAADMKAAEKKVRERLSLVKRRAA